MDGFIKGVFVFAFILWLPLFIAGVIACFEPGAIIEKIIYMVLVLAIWIPPIGAWLSTRD